MPNLTIDRTYADGEILLEADLDNIKSGIETITNTTKFDDSNIQNNSINSQHIIDNTVTTALLDSESVVSTKIVAANITTAKIASLAISTTDIADSNITNSKIDALAITSAKVLQSGTDLTVSQLLARPVWTSSTISAYSNNTTSFTTVESVSVSRTGTVTTRPFIAFLQPASSSTSYIKTVGGVYTSGCTYGMFGRFRVNGTVQNNSQLFGVTSDKIFPSYTFEDYIPPGAFFVAFSSSASSFTLDFQISARASGTTVSVDNMKIIVIEL